MTTNEFENARPFLRWAGSKRRLLSHLIPFIPRKRNKYYEPFLGGGSMFFFIGPSRAEISDASRSLIETYKSIRSDPDGILRYLKPLRPTRAAFERIKAQRLRSDTSRAGQFIFLNKACWNGLYRVNSDGIFNVPFGWPKTDFLIDENNLMNCSRLLRRRGVAIACQDFDAISDKVAEGDFVFFDPPYVTAHNMNGFVDWNERLFSWKDQIRLATLARKLIATGANVLITNANHPDVVGLYDGFGIKRIRRNSTLASDVSRRGYTSEAIIFAGPAYDDSRVALRRQASNAETVPSSENY